MEKKVYLWVALILGVPLLRLVEVFGVTFATGGLRNESIFGHVGLGLIIGIGCAMAANLMGLSDRRVLWALPALAVGYASALLFVAYPMRFFHQDPTYVSSLILMDLGSWAIAVFGASFVGYIISRPTVRVPVPAQTMGR